jgi:acetate kinase
VIVGHLGGGPSACALKDGRSAESARGFAALDGLPMGARPGRLDPCPALHLISTRAQRPRRSRTCPTIGPG